MAIQTTTFKGARYLVKFHDPIQWSASESYEAIEAVQYNAYTYISKQPVPAGVQISNTDFWLLWADPNAQMEQLRQLVSQYVDDVEELSGNVDDLSTELQNEIEARKLDIEKAHVFDTVADMKANANLSVGAICHTNGFHSVGDGGAAWYEISDSGTANEMDVIACGDLFAKLIVTTDYIRGESLGCYCDGTHDDTNILQYAINTYTSIEVGKTIFIDEITIKGTKRFRAYRVTSNSSNYAINLSDGQRSKIEISYLENTIGGGLNVNNSDNMLHEAYVNIQMCNCVKECLIFNNSLGVEECTFEGLYWLTRGVYSCIDVTKQNRYIGQMKMYISLIVALNGYAISLSSKNQPLTGFDFGYCSLQGSQAGILIELNSSSGSNNTMEAIRGVFRVVEFVTVQKTILKVIGNPGSIVTGCCIEFDRYAPWNIDTSELEGAGFTPKFLIKGPLYSNTGGYLYANEAYITLNGLTFEQEFPSQGAITTDDNDPDIWKTGSLQNIPKFIETSGDVNTLNIPSYWNGCPLYLYLGATTTVTFTIKNKPQTSISLASGLHTVIYTIDNANNPHIREI